MIEITLGHTPDADDAFMFYGLASENVGSNEFHITHVIEDIEKLNKRALNNELDITAISVYAYAFLKDYVILRSGGSFGINYGPIILAKEKFLKDDLNKKIIAIPGKMTSAYLLSSLLLGNFKEKELPFHIIPQAIIDNQVDAGLVIHEIQLAYKSLNLHKIIDLGSWWHNLTNGLPVPLGINVANNKTLTLEQIRRFDSLFKNSIIYGLNNIEEALDYAMKYGRSQSKDMISKFVKMYVNEITVDMGEKGKTSIERIFQLASERNIVSPFQIYFA
ncbi:MAG TPA: MqnA/MqnD/SBP family protein [Nitrososphaeraceae archaeon]|jgi:1,4-dihydroxy-6-naphthoate synthase|nr:MqnA/MqnD/SBP family protein [Nitrososphaeraceae archaeon]